MTCFMVLHIYTVLLVEGHKAVLLYYKTQHPSVIFTLLGNPTEKSFLFFSIATKTHLSALEWQMLIYIFLIRLRLQNITFEQAEYAHNITLRKHKHTHLLSHHHHYPSCTQSHTHWSTEENVGTAVFFSNYPCVCFICTTSTYLQYLSNHEQITCMWVCQSRRPQSTNKSGHRTIYFCGIRNNKTNYIKWSLPNSKLNWTLNKSLTSTASHLSEAEDALQMNQLSTRLWLHSNLIQTN